MSLKGEACIEKPSYGALASEEDQCNDLKQPGVVSKKKLGLLPFVLVIYYEVSGSAFGIENIVKGGGPFYALLGFCLMFVWAVPEALITAELSTAMPEASGSVAWVDKAFGPFWAFQKGWLSWLSGVADNALYPILFIDCLEELIITPSDGIGSSQDSVLGDETQGGNLYIRWGTILAITSILTYFNYRGMDVVGKLAIITSVASLVPFVIFCVVGAQKVDPAKWLVVPKGDVNDVDWRLLLNTFFWNINFWESAASFGGEVQDPERNYPRGMLLAVLLVFFSLFLPVLIGTGASDAPYTDWTDGFFVQLAREIVGPWLAWWFMLAALLTNISMFEAEMSSDSLMLAGMADRGILPQSLGRRHSQYGTPVYGILISAVGVVFLGALSFNQVIDMLNLLYCYGQLIEFLAFIYLRKYSPDMHRPFKIGIGLFGCCTMLLVPTVFIILILFLSSGIALTISLIFGPGLGSVLYQVIAVAREKRWCKFREKVSTIHEGLNESDQAGEMTKVLGGERKKYSSVVNS